MKVVSTNWSMARKAMRLTAMLAIRLMDWEAPLEAAAIRLGSGLKEKKQQDI